MSVHVSHEQSEIRNFISAGDPKKVAAYLANNPKLQRDLNDFYRKNLGQDFDVKAAIDAFSEADPEQVEQWRDYIGNYLDARGNKLPIGKMPFSVRRASSALEAKDNLKSAFHALERGSVTKGIVDLAAASLSAAGMTVTERKLTMALASASGIATISGLMTPAQASLVPQDILDHFNASSTAQTEVATSRLAVESVQKYEGGHIFSPYLISKMENSPITHQYMEWIIDAAGKNGLDPVLFANQLFRESIHFSERVIRGEKNSPVGAMGIAQFMPATGKNYGLYSAEDFFDPQKSIYAAARLMGDLTEDYNGDQVLAMVAYNGGPKAVEFVENALNKKEITSNEWIDFMSIRRAQFGKTDPSAWHVETLDYIKGITGKDMTRNEQNRAATLQGNDPLQFVQNMLSNNSALAAINRVAPMPTPLALRPQSSLNHNNS